MVHETWSFHSKKFLMLKLLTTDTVVTKIKFSFFFLDTYLQVCILLYPRKRFDTIDI